MKKHSLVIIKLQLQKQKLLANYVTGEKLKRRMTQPKIYIVSASLERCFVV